MSETNATPTPNPPPGPAPSTPAPAAPVAAPAPPARREPPAWRGWLVFLVALVATFGLGFLLASIIERREEARPRPPMRPIAADEVSPVIWGENFPREYETYLMTKGVEPPENDTRTKYGGAYPRDLLEETPANVVLFAGYAFAKDYKQARGHFNAVNDVLATQRISEKTPATCFTCKSPDMPRLLLTMTPKEFYAKSFAEVKPEIKHSIACYDCHTPNTMKLRVTRPALREAFERQGRDIDQATHQEMRSLVCAQCHVEYYFKAPGNYLTFPWDKGMTAEDIEKYYDEADFTDWVHAISKTKMLKMQHPDFEVYATGVHAYRNVSCADCHMPYKTEGGVKFTNHHIQSPLLDVRNSCGVCHRWPDEQIIKRVEASQDKVLEGRQMAEVALSKAHFDVAAARQAGATEEELQGPRKLLRSGQMRWDYVAANNGMGFHSPQECQKQLAVALDRAGECRTECARILARHGVTGEVSYPNVKTKEKAQALLRDFTEGKPPKLVP